MALRLRRDVQKASYYVWFLGAEEAKGLRGEHVINSVLPYLISRSRNMEPLKVTLQVSHKGIKIIQGSSKHLIPHSAITSSLQTDDMVACVLLLYNPATKCPLHVHGYRCDSESTAEALNQQLQILINRTENQKRFEELETRLGIVPPILPANYKSGIHNASKAAYPPPVQRHHETSPKRFSSSLGSDTGNSTRESECSEEHSGSSPLSRSPPHIATKSAMPIPSQLHSINNNHNNNELFDSLAAELRAKLNGNGPPLLLPPRDYDTVHRSKGNLTAIELRRCRNSLIVGGVETAGNSIAAVPPATTNATIKQVSSRGSSGIGSDLAPSPERHDLNTSSDEEQWSNEADSQVIALKPAQIPMERPAALVARQVAQLQRKNAKIAPPEDSYLRDLPAKPYNPRSNSNRDVDKIIPTVKGNKTVPWSKEDEIKPIIMRPTDYDAKFNRLIQAEREQKQQEQRAREPKIPPRQQETERAFLKQNSKDKYDINRILHKKLSLERDASPPPRVKRHDLEEDSAESDACLGEHVSTQSAAYRKENMTDKQKFLEYAAKRNGVAKDLAHKYGARQRYIDPADLPIDKTAIGPNKYAAVHRGTATKAESEGHSIDRHSRTPERPRQHTTLEAERRARSHEKTHGHNQERNPYREPESLPYIESMEKMYKSSGLRFKPNHEVVDTPSINKDVNLRNHKSYVNAEIEEPKSYSTLERGRHEYAKERYKESKQKFSAMEEQYNKSSSARRYTDWSDEERLEAELTPPPSPIPHAHVRSHSRSREQWDRRDMRQEFIPPTRQSSSKQKSHMQDMRDYRVERDNYAHYQVKDEYPHARTRDEHISHKERDYSPSRERNDRNERRHYEKQRVAPMYSAEMYPTPTSNVRNPEPPTSMVSSKSLSNLNKGYRHSYAEPVFGRSAGRVGLAAVNPY